MKSISFRRIAALLFLSFGLIFDGLGLWSFSGSCPSGVECDNPGGGIALMVGATSFVISAAIYFSPHLIRKIKA